MWRSNSFSKFILSDKLRRKQSVLESTPLVKNTSPDIPDDSSADSLYSDKDSPVLEPLAQKYKGAKDLIVTVVIVEAKGLPKIPDESSFSGVSCKFRLGARSFRTKSASNTRCPQWREQFELRLYNDPLLKISLWHKGKQKIFLGSCVLDLSNYERERTHDIWLTLDKGYGSVHLSVTMYNTRNAGTAAPTIPNVQEIRQKYAVYNLNPDLEMVGQLFVRVIGAKGFHGKPHAYCSLELDNEKVRTPSDHSSGEPTWNKSFVFNIYDVTSVLDVKVMDSSLTSSLLMGSLLGRVSIPLLRISDGVARWYILKDAAKRKSAKGNYPRIRLEMSMIWNPVTASLKLFRPKQVKYMGERPKFNLALVHKNLKFIRDTFNFLQDINEAYKRLFEWDDREFAFIILLVWLVFWFSFSPWTLPLFILLPFLHFWCNEHQRQHGLVISAESQCNTDEEQHFETVAHKIQGLPEMTFDIKDGIDYLVSVVERLNNLVTFKIPFLSWLTMTILLGSSLVFYYIPFRFLMIAFGIYKFMRKQMNPERVLNNDLLDFISRIPDNELLKDWREISVPEPHLLDQGSTALLTQSTSSRNSSNTSHVVTS